MATDDCFEIGRGPCPCGKGIITVEKCIPDHPWAKESQASYTPALACEVCKRKYAFFGRQLVLRSDLEQHREAEKNWHRKLREIEASQDFKDLAKKIDIRLAAERSDAARYRLLTAARLATGLSLQRFRRSGYQLSALHAKAALDLLQIQMQRLLAMADEADELADQMHRKPRGIKTGISGLEM
jgi:hypothetical protein